MNRRLFGTCGAIAVVILGFGSCKSDPLSDSDQVPAALVTEFSYLEVNVAAARSVTAYVVDGRSARLEVPVTFTACSPVITVTPDTGYHPIPPTSSRALVRGVTFGTSCVVVEGGGFVDTVQVATFPASIVISGPDTVESGDTVAFTYEYRDAANAPVAGVPAAAWTTGDTLRGTITAAAGMLAARDSGLLTITVTGTGSPAAGVVRTKQLYIKPAPFESTVVPTSADPGQIVTVRRTSGPIYDANTSVRVGPTVLAFIAGTFSADSFRVLIPDNAATGNVGVGLARLGPTEITQSPGAFTINAVAALAGTRSPASGVPGTPVVIKRTSGPVFDANTRVHFGGVRTFISSFSADSIVAPVPGVGATGNVELRLTRLDAGDVARNLTFTAQTAAFLLADKFDSTNNNPNNAPIITANGDYYVVVSGACANGAGGAGTDCDDWFRIRNTGGSAATVSISAAWLAGPDIDILLGSNPTSVHDFECEDGCAGASASNPESTSIAVPAGDTYYLWINLFAAGGAASTVARIRVSGLP